MAGCNHTVAKHVEVEGEIGHFGLDSWWLTTFSGAERRYIEKVYQHPGPPTAVRPLTTGGGPSVYESAAALLTAMASQLGKRAEERELALRLLGKAEEQADAENDVLALHSVYDEMVRLYDRWKEQFPDASDAAFAACYKQARIGGQAARAFHDRYPMRALPTHAGYELMTTLLAEVDNYERAIDTCRQARAQGWPGDWTARIQQLTKDSGCPVRYISSSGMTQI